MIRGIIVKTTLPRHLVGNRPHHITSKLRTEVLLSMVTTKFITVQQGIACYIAEVEREGREVERTCQFSIKRLQLIFHTDTKVEIERRHEVGIGKLIVGFQSSSKLRISQQLQGIIPFFRCLQSEFTGQTKQVVVGFK